MKLDRSRDFCEVHGPDGSWLEQDGLRFTHNGDLRDPPPLEGVDSKVIPTDVLVGAQAFLKHILKGRPLAKATVFNAAKDNNQPWGEVKKAAEELKLVKFKFNNTETWKLPEDADA